MPTLFYSNPVYNVPCSIAFSVSFGNVFGGRGVDHWGHSLNDPIEGIVEYKHWAKTARYIHASKKNQKIEKGTDCGPGIPNPLMR